MRKNEFPDDPQPWLTLSRRYLHRRPWLTVREDHVRLPNGAEIPTYWVSEFPAWVNVVARTEGGDLVLVRQYRHGIAAVHYELPAGVVGQQEEPIAAARRELAEETGYGGGRWTALMRLSANPALQNNITYCFLAEGADRVSEAAPDPTEDLRVHLISQDEVLSLIDSGAILQALHLAPLLRVLLASGQV